ncbi:hypothetical protein GCM10010207_66200 [Streptomyces atratus]|nr:hypothetical protein GCM10010207_66200 [Streptomyces atratus]
MRQGRSFYGPRRDVVLFLLRRERPGTEVCEELQGWRPGTPPPAPIGPDNPGADIRIGYARCSSVKHYTRNLQHPLVGSMPQADRGLRLRADPAVARGTGDHPADR